MKKTIVVASIALSACAMSSGVQKMGPDTYTVSAAAAPARGGAIGAKQVALNDAGQYCAAMGKEILVTNTTSATTNNMGAGNFDLTFRCLAKGDPDLQRPDYRAPPSTVVEDRRSK